MELKDKIQIYRKSKNMSQEKLAEELGVSRQTVSKWEAGESYPDINNLIAFSNLFQISIDRLLKDDYCTEEQKLENVLNDALISFLIDAKRKTYAGSGQEESISSRPNYHDLKYEDGKYKYIDTYFGGERFIGEEALFIQEIPVWAMNYSGCEINEDFSSAFLKLALSHVSSEMPFRGPSIFQDGEYLYLCHISGNFEWFQGQEEIYYQKKKVYECYFHGGIIR